MTDIGDTIAPKSNQMNADDLVAGPLTLTITEVRVHDTGDQPVHVFFAEWPTGRPWKPSLGMRRWLMFTACVTAPGATRTAFVTFESGVPTPNSEPMLTAWGADEIVGRGPLNR